MNSDGKCGHAHRGRYSADPIPGAENEGACTSPGVNSHNYVKSAFSDRIFEYRQVETRKLMSVLVITFVAMSIEVVGGILTGSISLIGDAGHMFTHVFAVIISIGAIIIARNPPCHHRTYGLFRAEILAAFLNSLFLFAVTLGIVYESIRRLFYPVKILGIEMFFIAFFGLVINLITMIMLRGNHHDDINIRGVFLHLLSDTISSIAIVIGAVLIYFSGARFIDPLIGLFISAVIFFWAWSLFKESSRILLEMAPRGLDIESLETDLKGMFDEIEALSNVHFWAITSDMYVFTTHLKLDQAHPGSATPEEVIRKINFYLKNRYPIIESTIQLVY